MGVKLDIFERLPRADIKGNILENDLLKFSVRAKILKPWQQWQTFHHKKYEHISHKFLFICLIDIFWIIVYLLLYLIIYFSIFDLVLWTRVIRRNYFNDTLTRRRDLELLRNKVIFDIHLMFPNGPYKMVRRYTSVERCANIHTESMDWPKESTRMTC